MLSTVVFFCSSSNLLHKFFTHLCEKKRKCYLQLKKIPFKLTNLCLAEHKLKQFFFFPNNFQWCNSIWSWTWTDLDKTRVSKFENCMTHSIFDELRIIYRLNDWCWGVGPETCLASFIIGGQNISFLASEKLILYL